ncbi:MAG: hypothetical protein Q8K86_07025 [Candidatus Nanopelagicaceae bacterium]|nr:hypothetical protein [Candidatus Nanopelagicaceae bacterium]
MKSKQTNVNVDAFGLMDVFMLSSTKRRGLRRFMETANEEQLRRFMIAYDEENEQVPPQNRRFWSAVKKPDIFVGRISQIINDEQVWVSGLEFDAIERILKWPRRAKRAKK